MRIGEIAARARVSVRALRYYEEQGLLAPTRTSGGQRRYADGAVERVRWIQLLLGAGLPSKTIRDFLPCAESGEVTRRFCAGSRGRGAGSTGRSQSCSRCATGSMR